ncbi:hypothetical protein [Aquimarina pacifica]|uniref:hypothetical protein n=1 Tax=Aquimarina pacifica TaxID=1296415 RepID=UPI000470DF15|nr:hypothetical protein [Aquimarina pacifica]
MKNIQVLGFLLLLFANCTSSDDNQVSNDDVLIDEPSIRVEVLDDFTILNFGDLVTGVSKELEIRIHNDGNAVLSISRIELPNGYKSNWESGSIQKEASQDVTITFSPDTETEYLGDLILYNNDSNTNQLHVEIIGKGVSATYDEDLLLTTQEELNDFIARGYTAINGDLCLGWCNPTGTYYDLTNLLPLQQIKKIKNLNINNTLITSLEGIEDIELEETNVTMWNNIELENLDFFPTKKSIIHVINLRGNEKLENIDGLSHITSINICLISNQENLENINGLSNIDYLYQLEMAGCPKIDNLDALSNVATVEGDIRIRNNNILYNYCGLKPLFTSGSFTGILYTEYNRYNPSRSEVSDGDCDREIPENTYHGDMRIDSAVELATFTAYNFEKIEGDLTIFGDVEGDEDEELKISDLSTLSNLTEVTGEFWISYTDIPNLKGLENLAHVGTTLQIRNNRALTNYCDILPLIQSLDFTAGFQVEDNFFNPSVEELTNGTCSE